MPQLGVERLIGQRENVGPDGLHERQVRQRQRALLVAMPHQRLATLLRHVACQLLRERRLADARLAYHHRQRPMAVQRLVEGLVELVELRVTPYERPTVDGIRRGRRHNGGRCGQCLGCFQDLDGTHGLCLDCGPRHFGGRELGPPTLATSPHQVDQAPAAEDDDEDSNHDADDACGVHGLSRQPGCPANLPRVGAEGKRLCPSGLASAGRRD